MDIGRAYRRGLADELTADDWTADMDDGLHPHKCRCPECDPDWHRDVARFDGDD